jgi:hypothetical protein
MAIGLWRFVACRIWVEGLQNSLIIIVALNKDIRVLEGKKGMGWASFVGELC